MILSVFIYNMRSRCCSRHYLFSSQIRRLFSKKMGSSIFASIVVCNYVNFRYLLQYLMMSNYLKPCFKMTNQNIIINLRFCIRMPITQACTIVWLHEKRRVYLNKNKRSKLVLLSTIYCNIVLNMFSFSFTGKFVLFLS